MAINGDSYQLPGGHREKNESYKNTIIREVCEETGITLEENEIGMPFYKISRYTHNYLGSGKNRISDMIYFSIKTDKAPDLSKISLTTQEKENNFHLALIPYSNFEYVMKDYLTQQKKDSLNEFIASETLDAFLMLQQIDQSFTL